MVQARWLIQTVDQLHNTLTLHKKPNGTEEFPAPSCCDVIKNYPNVESGMSLLEGMGWGKINVPPTRTILDRPQRRMCERCC